MEGNALLEAVLHVPKVTYANRPEQTESKIMNIYCEIKPRHL